MGAEMPYECACQRLVMGFHALAPSVLTRLFCYELMADIVR